MSDLARRVVAAQATQDAFVGRPFVWGESDCLRLACHALIGLGYKLKTRLRAKAAYTDEAGALRALRRAGYSDTPDIMDGLGLPRIPPAAALPGDILGIPGDGMTALGVAISNGRCLMFAGGACIIGGNHTAGSTMAWRAQCLR